jgi:hypothetical protein
MKKLILILSILSLVLVLVGADIRRNDSSNLTVQTPTKKRCVGYTIIEFGKGIDCNGDTVALKRLNGVQVLAVN